MNPSNEVLKSDAQASGVPLGGVGTGKIDFAPDGSFRNITINNNRFAEEIIPKANNAFLAIRCASANQTVARVLQPGTDLPFDEANIPPPYLFPGEQKWRGLYPISSYSVQEDAFPIPVIWKGTAPVIPYDMEASGLPMIIISTKFKNTTQVRLQVSAMMTWENLRGCRGEDTVDDRGGMEPIYYFDTDQVLLRQSNLGSLESMPYAGMGFGLDKPPTFDAEGNYCLSAIPSQGAIASYCGWNRNAPGELAEVWDSFQSRGELPNRCSREDVAHMGSICMTALIEPGATRKLEFVLSWYCPNYALRGKDAGNDYTSEYRDAVEVATQGVKLSKYIQASVSNWHNHFIRSSLPTWYSRLLINSAHVLTSNSIATRSGDFSMMESYSIGDMSPMDVTLLQSLGTLLFLPTYAERELDELSATDNTPNPGRMYTSLGHKTPFAPNYGTDKKLERIDVNAAFILMAYRNYHMTGKLTTLRHLFPKLKAAAEYALTLDKDRDGVPDAHGACTTFAGWPFEGLTSYGASLWIVAFRAMASLAESMNDKEGSKRFNAVSRRALANFESHLWVEAEGFYRAQRQYGDEANSVEICHMAQLVGPWLAAWLDLDCGFSESRIRRAMESIERLCRRNAGYARCTRTDGTTWPSTDDLSDGDTGESLWPFHEASFWAGALLEYGDVDAGLSVLKKYYEEIYGESCLAFNTPKSLPSTGDAGSHSGSMAVWHSLFSLQGMFFSVPTKTLTLKPRFPNGVDKMLLPVLTPVSFGRLHYERTGEPEAMLRVRVHFDSPLAIGVIRLSVPKIFKDPQVKVRLNDERVEFSVDTQPGESHNLVIITLTEVLQIKVPIQITVS